MAKYSGTSYFSNNFLQSTRLRIELVFYEMPNNFDFIDDGADWQRGIAKH
jgi:hypothetical protein